MLNLLQADGIESEGDQRVWHEIVREMKESIGFVSLDPAAERSKAENGDELHKEYSLPDGQSITINAPRCAAPEALFHPEQIKDIGVPGMHKLLHESISSCDYGIRKGLLQNVIVCGGSTLFPGLCERLEQEVGALLPDAKSV